MNAEEIALYLKTHPEFFEQHADLLTQIRIPDPHGGAAVSLAERQMTVLRDKARALESKLAELIGYGEENDIIAEKVHRLGVALLGVDDLAEAVRVLNTHLSGSFAVPHVAVRIWGVGGSQDDAPEYSPVPDTLKAFAGSIHRPYCGGASGQEAVALFGEQGGHIRSLAQIPLREDGVEGGACFGLLVLASEEVERFYPDMGVMFLNRIGDMAASTLLRVVH
ncbi:DUF484 family protein [Denitratisoma oestradiolicum]|uniref:DUF484 domain-containing protein n=1 Tax=Denitratisoma oestradiolicum TaxID=311182 RepID=A0A6S6Y5D8_9PROT|nr:DUF484 family protein [Denitratisoma oestradiolicum]TWO81737.1 hypothetical protein CBW56_03240 [Denitratisoma oestradiolicum]CAB1370687.1 conserved protein of unknown function [Denitratisoma oestradiolicum]